MRKWYEKESHSLYIVSDRWIFKKTTIFTRDMNQTCHSMQKMKRNKGMNVCITFIVPVNCLAYLDKTTD